MIKDNCNNAYQPEWAGFYLEYKFNTKYLSDFQQGRNSNNKDRNTKISIKNKDLENDNFVIYRQKL